MHSVSMNRLRWHGCALNNAVAIAPKCAGSSCSTMRFITVVDELIDKFMRIFQKYKTYCILMAVTEHVQNQVLF